MEETLHPYLISVMVGASFKAFQDLFFLLAIPFFTSKRSLLLAELLISLVDFI